MTENTITFTPKSAHQLLKLYNKAMSEGKTEFYFEGHLLLCSYAKYLLEYLKTKNLLK